MAELCVAGLTCMCLCARDRHEGVPYIARRYRRFDQVFPGMQRGAENAEALIIRYFVNESPRPLCSQRPKKFLVYGIACLSKARAAGNGELKSGITKTDPRKALNYRATDC